MTLQQRLTLLAQAIGVDIKSLFDTKTEILPRKFSSGTDCVSSSLTEDFTVTAAGLGVSWASVTTENENAVGILRCNIGTLISNRASISSTNLGVINLGIGTCKFMSRQKITTLSDSTINTYSYRAGFINSITAESTNGVFFRYTNAVNGGRWQAVCKSGVSETAVDTGVTATANVWLNFEITTTPTQVVFKINGNIVATITTNIPNGATKSLGYGVVALRTLGVTATNIFDIDYIYVEGSFTNPR